MYTYDLGYSTLGALILMEKATQSGKGKSKVHFLYDQWNLLGHLFWRGEPVM